MQALMRRSSFLAVATLVLACKGTPGSGPKGSAGSSVVLARVDDIAITAADLKEVLTRYKNQPFVLARYSSIDRRKELLDSLVRYEVLAIEARNRGYLRDPEVQRIAKDEMVRRLVRQEIDDKANLSDISDAEVKRFYQTHLKEYTQPETVRASLILIRDRAKATRVLARARALPKADMKDFRDLVAEYSEDADSQQRGGDLTQFARKTTQYPPAIVSAAFALKETGDVSGLVPTDKGYAILKLTDHRSAHTRPLKGVSLDIKKRMLNDLRAKERKEFIEQARKRIKVEIYQDQLTKLDLGDPAASGRDSALPPGPQIQRAAVLDAGGVVKKGP